MDQSKDADQASDTPQALLAELYQGEVFGEASIVEMLKRYTAPDQVYKLASILQLETETKARIRPVALAYGVDMVESAQWRDNGIQALAPLAGMSWDDAVAAMAHGIQESVDRYREIAAKMPPELAQFGQSMREHEEALQTFFVKEASGDSTAIEAITALLINPLPTPDQSKAPFA